MKKVDHKNCLLKRIHTTFSFFFTVIFNIFRLLHAILKFCIILKLSIVIFALKCWSTTYTRVISITYLKCIYFVRSLYDLNINNYILSAGKYCMKGKFTLMILSLYRLTIIQYFDDNTVLWVAFQSFWTFVINAVESGLILHCIDCKFDLN